MPQNGRQICDVADLIEISFNLQPMFIRSRMFQLKLNPPYTQMCWLIIPLFLIVNKLPNQNQFYLSRLQCCKQYPLSLLRQPGQKPT